MTELLQTNRAVPNEAWQVTLSVLWGDSPVCIYMSEEWRISGKDITTFAESIGNTVKQTILNHYYGLNQKDEDD